MAGASTTKHLRLEWHPARDLLGVCSQNAESGGGFGGKPFFSSKVRAQSAPTCFCWHPTESLLAVGWETGHLSLVDPTKRTESEDLDVGLGRICCLLWDASGSLLIAVDIKGDIQSFQFDESESRLDHLSSARMKEETPRDVCCKRIPKKLMHPQSAGSGAKFAGKEQQPSSRATMGSGGQKKEEADSTLAQLLSQHKHRKWGSFDEVGEEEKEKTTFSPLVDTICVFIIGTEQGGVFMFEPRGNQLNRIFQADSGIRQLLDMPGQLYFLAITDGMMFYQLAIEGRLANDKIKVKLGAQSKHFQILRVDSHTVAFAYGEREIRIWDLRAEDSAILRLNADRGYESSDEQVLMINYSSKKDSICGVTNKWRLATWRRVRDNSEDGSATAIPMDQQWKLATGISLNIPKVIGMSWSNISTAFALNSGDSVQIFLSQCVEYYADSDYAVIQVSAQLLTLVKIRDPVETQELQLHSNIRGFYLIGDHLLLWDDAKIQLDLIKCPTDGPIQIANLASFDVQNVQKAAYYNQHVYTLANEQLLVHTLQGTVKRAITFREIEGRPEQISVKGKWLCVASSLGYFRIYDLSESSMKLTFRSSNLCNSIPEFGHWLSIRINSAGNRVSFTVQKKDDDRPSERLYVWEAENDSVGHFSFHLGITDQQQYEQEALERGTTSAANRPKTAAIRKIEFEQSRFRLPTHLPGNHFWDQNDPRLLVCEAISAVGGGAGNDWPTPSHLLTMFVTSEHGIQMHDLQPKVAKADSLVFVAVPFIYFLRNIEVDDEDDLSMERSISRLIFRRTLREFVGIDPQDAKAVQAMLDFSFFLSIGQMDNAFKAIKFIKSDSVWEHMARMCVKTRRIDVARVCLGHMGNARAVRVIRRTIEDKEPPDMQIARLAIELGMMEEAIRLFEKSGNWDCVNRAYQAQGKWTEAFEVAEKRDRIHLRHTHYSYAKHLESVGAIEKAIEHYEKANVHHFEVPRMLCDEPKVLEFYVKKRAEPELFKWWAQFLESSGDVETAKNYYQSARDFFSLVRILCCNGQIEEAALLVNQTGNRAAAFHLALQFETVGDYGQTVHYFSQAGAFASAIRLAKEHNMVDRLANLALMAGGSELVEAADFYKDLEGHADKAVMLYHKAGMIGRALDYAFRTGQFGALDLIAQELNEKSDPAVLIRAAEFFSANQQDRTAVQLLVYAKKFSEAVQLCLNKNVIVTEQLDNLLTPNKLENLTPTERSRLLEQIAGCCLQQGNYHFAAKKFTQAGNKIEAMRALLKSGDTQKVILFANTARDKQIHRMAGNYLQNLNWKDDAQLMRQIEAFYVKAGAMDLLSNFYEACAQVEIDEFHDYEKAAAAYAEALRCLNKKLDNKKDAQQQQKDQQQEGYLLERQEQLRETLETIRRFLDIKILYETDPGESMRQLGDFSERPGINEIVRLGDIFAILIGHNVKRDNFRKAWQLVEHCEQRSRPRIDIRQYLGKQLLNQICDQNGVPRLKSSEKGNRGAEEAEETEDGGTVEFSHALRRRIRDANDGDGSRREEDE